MKTILAIETSCDETGIAIVQGSGKIRPRIWILENVISSQIAIHKLYGGVVPHLAAREHEKNLPIVLKRVLARAKKYSLNKHAIDAIAVTKGPGLAPALWRGINFAKNLAKEWSKPLFGIDHMEGHLCANFINEVSGISNFPPQLGEARPIKLGGKTKNSQIMFPILCLTVSGGHTQLVLMRDWAKYELLGETLDDAAGEAFDKVARMLGLPYPGGPPISKLAETGDPNTFSFPRPMINAKNYNFSFSGLKTAVLYHLRGQNSLTNIKKLPRNSASSPRLSADAADIAASFQQAVIDVLITKTVRAAKEYDIKTLMLAGGVAANKELRKQLAEKTARTLPHCIIRIPPVRLCADNAAMIGAAAYIRIARGEHGVQRISAEPSRQINDP